MLLAYMSHWLTPKHLYIPCFGTSNNLLQLSRYYTNTLHAFFQCAIYHHTRELRVVQPRARLQFHSALVKLSNRRCTCSHFISACLRVRARRVSRFLSIREQ